MMDVRVVVGAMDWLDSDDGAGLVDCPYQAWETASQVVGSDSQDDGSDDGQYVVVVDRERIECSAKAGLQPEERRPNLHA